MEATRIAIIGECMVELQKTGEFYKQSFGGDTLNTALYLSRLTAQHQVTTSYITGLGQDNFSQAMLSAWQDENINVDLVYQSATKQPGLYTIETDSEGERSFQYWRDDAAAKFWLLENDVATIQAQLNQQDLIYLSGISLAILPDEAREILFSLLLSCKSNGVKIAFDNNYRPRLWESKEKAQAIYQQMLALTDIAFITFDDDVLLFDDQTEQQSIERTQALGVSEIVMKRGSDDCFVITGQTQISVPSQKVTNIIDTTAAGDSFSAGYLAKRILGGTQAQSANAGHLLASQVIQHAGAIIPAEFMPTI